MAMTLEELYSNFEFLTEWEDRYAYLIDVGRQLPDLPEDAKTEENRVKGCQATVWLKEKITGSNPPVLEFEADSNSAIVKGLIAIMLMIYSGKSAPEILQTDALPIFAKLELDQHLSPTRKIGLRAMMQEIKSLAASTMAEQTTQ